MKTYRVHFSIMLAALFMLMLQAQGSRFPAGWLATAVHASAQQPPPSKPPQDDEFVPVKDLGDQERLPAAPLVMGAYAVAWVAIVLYLWSIWRRLSRVESEIAAVSRRIDAATRPGGRQ
jgi:CcmD family protein